MRRFIAILSAALVSITLAAAPASAAPRHDRGQDTSVLDFQGATQRLIVGLSCDSLPSAVSVLVTSDSSRRVASAEFYRNDSIDGGPPRGVLIGTGKVMVLKGMQLRSDGQGGWITPTVERPGPPAHKRTTCAFSNPTAFGTAELVFLGELPTAIYEE